MQLIRFLVKHPVSTITAFALFVMLGVALLFKIPVSLMPDVEPNSISIKVNAPGYAAENIAKQITIPLKNKLLQTSKLKKITSITKDGVATFYLTFDRNTDADYFALEVNERIDEAMNSLPPELERPLVIKSSLTEAPVLTMFIQSKHNQDIAQWGNWVEGVIKPRIEQLPSVALADLSGKVSKQVAIDVHYAKLKNYGLSIKDIENVLQKYYIKENVFLVKEGIYNFQLKLNNPLKSVDFIKSLIIQNESSQIKLSEIATVNIINEEKDGVVFFNGQPAIALRIIKQGDQQIYQMQDDIQQLINEFEQQYSDMVFHITRDQTKLLRLTIENLLYTLLFSIVFAFVVTSFFMKSWKTTIIIGISIPMSLLITLVFFYMLNITINIISLSGLILGVGMMIDNVIIVLENIEQKRRARLKHLDSFITGTSEVAVPMLSSVLTTCVVFLPVLLLEGVLANLFLEEALAVGITLIVSFLISIGFVPVLHSLIYDKNINIKPNKTAKYFTKLNAKILHFGLRNPRKVLILLVFIVILSFWGSINVKKALVPTLSYDNLIVDIEWNIPVNMAENKRRCNELIKSIDIRVDQIAYELGQPQYLLPEKKMRNQNHSQIFIQLLNSDDAVKFKTALSKKFAELFPKASIEIKPEQTTLYNFLPETEAKYIFKIRPVDNQLLSPENALAIAKDLQRNSLIDAVSLPIQEQYQLVPNFQLIRHYNLSLAEIIDYLNFQLGLNKLDRVRVGNEQLPIIIKQASQNLSTVLNGSTIQNKKGLEIPLSKLLDVTRIPGWAKIAIDESGSFINFDAGNSISDLSIADSISSNYEKQYNSHFSIVGGYLKEAAMTQNILYILLVTFILLYFILVIQFESLLLPLILLIEIPIDISIVLLMMNLFGISLNIMSGVAIVIMSGIIINDSILKISTIRRYEKNHRLERSILVGSHRRTRPIIMTSLTTILALLPFFFFGGVGGEMQKPFSITLIIGMIVGTIVSLYIIPILYHVFRKALN